MRVDYPGGWNESEARAAWQVGKTVQGPSIRRIFIEARTPIRANWIRIEECEDEADVQDAINRLSPYYELDLLGSLVRGELRVRVETEMLNDYSD